MDQCRWWDFVHVHPPGNGAERRGGGVGLKRGPYTGFWLFEYLGWIRLGKVE